jgi:hypothetical protein
MPKWRRRCCTLLLSMHWRKLSSVLQSISKWVQNSYLILLNINIIHFIFCSGNWSFRSFTGSRWREVEVHWPHVKRRRSDGNEKKLHNFLKNSLCSYDTMKLGCFCLFVFFSFTLVIQVITKKKTLKILLGTLLIFFVVILRFLSSSLVSPTAPFFFIFCRFFFFFIVCLAQWLIFFCEQTSDMGPMIAN